MIDLAIGSVAGKTIVRPATEEEQQRLIHSLLHRKSRIRWMAANTLGKLKVQEAVEPLIATLKDPQWLVRLHAATALGRIGNSRADQALRQALNDESFFVRRRAVIALGLVSDETIIPFLLCTLRKDKKLWDVAAQSLITFMSPSAAYLLLHAVTTSERKWPSGRSAKFGARFTPVLVWIMKHGDMQDKRIAIWALKEAGDERAIESLNKLVTTTKTSWQIGWEIRSAVAAIEARKYEGALKDICSGTER